MTVEEPQKPPRLKAIGGVDEILKEVQGKRLKPMTVQEGPDAVEAVELPAWFRRTGIRLFEIDTGLGIVKCAVPRIERKDASRNPSEEELQHTVFMSLREIPDWMFEEATHLNGKRFEPGDPIPQPHELKASNPQMVQLYLVNLPRSIPHQVVLALGFMGLPPLPVDPLV